ncbi:hypothetical protein ACPF8X_03510 [Streptomyces sp. G35A]
MRMSWPRQFCVVALFGRATRAPASAVVLTGRCTPHRTDSPDNL